MVGTYSVLVLLQQQLQARVENHLIKTLGRWSSNCYQTYIHTPKSCIREVQRSMCRHQQ